MIWWPNLTHWGRVTHICVSKLTIIGSDNGLSPGWGQAIIWSNAGILLIEPIGTKFCEILIKIHTFSFKKMPLKCHLWNGGHFVWASMCYWCIFDTQPWWVSIAAWIEFMSDILCLTFYFQIHHLLWKCLNLWITFIGNLFTDEEFQITICLDNNGIMPNRHWPFSIWHQLKPAVGFKKKNYVFIFTWFFGEFDCSYFLQY